MEASLRVMANCTGCVTQKIFIPQSKNSRLAVTTLVEVTALLKEECSQSAWSSRKTWWWSISRNTGVPTQFFDHDQYQGWVRWLPVEVLLIKDHDKPPFRKVRRQQGTTKSLFFIKEHELEQMLKKRNKIPAAWIFTQDDVSLI